LWRRVVAAELDDNQYVDYLMDDFQLGGRGATKLLPTWRDPA
jgi:hypothetical protein